MFEVSKNIQFLRRCLAVRYFCGKELFTIEFVRSGRSRTRSLSKNGQLVMQGFYEIVFHNFSRRCCDFFLRHLPTSRSFGTEVMFSNAIMVCFNRSLGLFQPYNATVKRFSAGAQYSVLINEHFVYLV
jgi:hypothetical protein